MFTEGGVVATDDTVYTGFGFEGINESARTEFLRRTLTHLGVAGRGRAAAGRGGRRRAGAAGGGTVGGGQGKGRAYAKIKVGKQAPRSIARAA